MRKIKRHVCPLSMPRHDWTVRTALCADRLPVTHEGMRVSNKTSIIVSYNYMVHVHNIGDEEVNNRSVDTIGRMIIINNKQGPRVGVVSSSSEGLLSAFCFKQI